MERALAGPPWAAILPSQPHLPGVDAPWSTAKGVDAVWHLPGGEVWRRVGRGAWEAMDGSGAKESN